MRRTQDTVLFQSSNKKKEKEFQATGIKSKFDFTDKSQAIYFMMAGHCPIAEEMLRDINIGYDYMVEKEKELKRGNYCPIKVEHQILSLLETFFIKMGYKKSLL